MSDKYHGHITHDDGSHTPLTKEQAKALWEGIEKTDAARKAQYPDSATAIAVTLPDTGDRLAFTVRASAQPIYHAHLEVVP